MVKSNISYIIQIHSINMVLVFITLNASLMSSSESTAFTFRDINVRNSPKSMVPLSIIIEMYSSLYVFIYYLY